MPQSDEAWGDRKDAGVRVRVTEEAKDAAYAQKGSSRVAIIEAAAPHMEVTVSRKVRDRIAAEIEAADEAGESYRHLADVILTEILGLTLTDGDDDA